MHTSRPGGGDSLRLALLDVLTLTLGNETQNLQHQVCDEGAHQIFPVPSVEQRHVDNADVNADVFSQHPPLALDFLVFSAQAVNTEDIE